MTNDQYSGDEEEQLNRVGASEEEKEAFRNRSATTPVDDVVPTEFEFTFDEDDSDRPGAHEVPSYGFDASLTPEQERPSESLDGYQDSEEPRHEADSDFEFERTEPGENSDPLAGDYDSHPFSDSQGVDEDFHQENEPDPFGDPHTEAADDIGAWESPNDDHFTDHDSSLDEAEHERFGDDNGFDGDEIHPSDAEQYDNLEDVDSNPLDTSATSHGMSEVWKRNSLIFSLVGGFLLLLIIGVVAAIVFSSPPASKATTYASATSTEQVGEAPIVDPQSIANAPLIRDDLNNSVVGDTPPDSTSVQPGSPLKPAELEAYKREAEELKDALSLLLTAYDEQDSKLVELENRDVKNQADIQSLEKTISELKSAIHTVSKATKTPAVQREKVVQNRHRLGSFNILSVDKAGMVTAVSPSGRRITLVEGEGVYIGHTTQKVSKIYPDLLIATIGQRWYIDVRRAKETSAEKSYRLSTKPARPSSPPPPRDADVRSEIDIRQVKATDAFEIAAVVGEKVILRDCETGQESLFSRLDSLPGEHGQIRLISSSEVITDRSIIYFNSCN